MPNVYRTKNQNNLFRRVGKKVAKKIASIDGVIGIIACGGIGRGFSDFHSDLDFFVYADDTKAKEIASYIAVGQLCYKNIHFDIPVHSIEKAERSRVPSKYWCQEMRWTLEYSEIWHDTGGRIERLLQDKVILPEEELKRLLKHHRHHANEILNYIYHSWLDRGWPYNLAHLIRLATGHIILWIYLKNGLFLPYKDKWLFYYFERSLIPEVKYFLILKKAMSAPITTFKEADVQRMALLKVASQIGMDMEPVTLAETFEKNRRNWHNASEKTRKYLSF